ncbi:MAG: Uma2 family endonuclease [Thermomicrobiales bacterium]|nr:Uma2 family endonuclease [Thermomicrobiales bacterium]
MSRTAPLQTASDLRALPDEGLGFELLSGTLIAREAPADTHERLVDRLREALSAHVEDGDLGALFRAPWPVEISRYDVVRPDLAFVSWGRDGVIDVDGVKGAPELIVEVLSPDSRERDRGEKQRLYAWAKVFEYWVVDPEAGTFEALTRTRAGYQPIPHDGRTFQSVLLPDLRMELSELFG